MGDYLASGGGGGDIPPENPGDERHDIKKWELNLANSLAVAYKTKVETKELLYGIKLGGQLKQLPVSAVQNLATERFALKNLCAPVGYTFNVLVVQQHPFQQNEDMPLFELEKFTDEYKTMESEMANVYAESYAGPDFILEQAPVGTCAVLRTWPDDDEDAEHFAVYEQGGESLKPIVKRIRILGVVNDKDAGRQVYNVAFIDDNTVSVVETQDEIFPMDKYLAILPPRICDIELEGLGYYKDDELIRRFLRYDSDEYVFDETPVTAEVQASGQVLVWNDNFPKENFPYGINGFILKSIWEAMSFQPVLPPKGCEKEEGYIVNTDLGAYVWLHFPSLMAIHFQDILSGLSSEVFENLQGSVKRPERGIIYLVPHHRSDCSFYRAEIISPVANLKKMNNPEDLVQIQLIDYGDKVSVPVKTLVRAVDVHVLLPLFPRLCVKAHLENICGFQPAKFLNEFHSKLESSFGVFVVREKTASEPAEVLLKHYMNDGEDKFRVLNNEAVRRNVAVQVDPSYDHAKVMEVIGKHSIPNPMQYSMPPYLGLGPVATRRLQIGTEVDTFIFWNKKMPRGWFFIRAVHRHHILKQMEQKLGELKQKMLKSAQAKSQQRYRNAVLRQRGMGVLVVSKVVHYVLLRGILIEECRQEEKATNVNVEGPPRNEASIEKVPTTSWKVYLFDYGIVEKVEINSISKIPLEYLQIPAFGILAKHVNFKRNENVQNWWNSMPGSSRMPDNSPAEEDIDNYDESQSVQRKVKILKLATKWPYGETAVVDWVTQRNEDGNIGSKARKQIVKVKQENFAGTDPLEAMTVKKTVQVEASATKSQALKNDAKLEIDKMGSPSTSSVVCACSSQDSAVGRLEESCGNGSGNDNVVVTPPKEVIGVVYCASDSDSLEDSDFFY